jgi:hypothetical protein
MAAPVTRNKHERREHLNLVAELYGQGKSYREMAKLTGRASIGAIAYDIKELLAEWREQRVSSVEQARLDELARLDWLEAEATEAWIRSQDDDSEQTLKTNPVQQADGKFKDEPISRTLKTKKKPGDAKFLDVIGKCIETRCKIWGLLQTDRGDTNILINANGQQQQDIADRIANLRRRYAESTLPADDAGGQAGVHVNLEPAREIRADENLALQSGDLRTGAAGSGDVEEAGGDTYFGT